MTTAAASTFALRPHPATLEPSSASAPVVRALQVHATWVDANTLRLHYVLEADLAALRIPEPATPPSAIDGLWQHTCFEAFIGTVGAEGYHEFNFSPSGNWAIYTFMAEREREPTPKPLPAPRIACTATANTLSLQADVSLQALPAKAPWHFGLSAVIELADDSKLYWALHHPAPQPDFHAKSGWAAQLNAPPSTPPHA